MRSPLQASESDSLDELEELGDDAIIAQQTEAHAPRPRANISEESRSVVISDHPQRQDTRPPSRMPLGSGLSAPRGEATVIIRDRRALDQLRKEVLARQTRKRRGNRPLYLWGALGVLAFLLGCIVAFLATDSHSAGQTADEPGQGARIEAQPLVSAAPLAAPLPAPESTTRAVRLDDLPVEPRHKN